MAKKGEIYLGPAGSEGLLSAFGRSLIITPNEISRSRRMKSGRLVTDYQTTKYQFELPYELIDGNVLDGALALWGLHTTLTLKAYIASDTVYFTGESGAAPLVKLAAIKRRRVLLLGYGLWSDASLVLDEI